MTIFSTLRQKCPSLISCSPFLKSSAPIGIIFKRHGGHGNTMPIVPSSFNWNKTKDLLHLYTWIAALFYGSIIIYANVFVGQPILAEIPDGYKPKDWEYHKHPITRFIVKYCRKGQQEAYEQFLQFLYEEDEMQKLRELDDKMERTMKAHKDYEAYFYKPLTVIANAVREDRDESSRYMFFSDHLTTDNFPTDAGPKDSDLSDEFSSIPKGVEE